MYAGAAGGWGVDVHSLVRTSVWALFGMLCFRPVDGQEHQHGGSRPSLRLGAQAIGLVPGGLAPSTVRDLVGVVAERFEIAAAALTAYDPTYDERMLAVGLHLLGRIADVT